MLLQRLAAALTTRRPWPPLHSPIYESVPEEWADDTDADGTEPGPAPTEPGAGGCAAMSRVDSGHETLADDDSPTPTFEDGVAEPQHIYEEVWTPAAPAPARLPNISGVLQHTGPVIRPVACRPTPTHTPSATPTRFGSVEHINRPTHYGSALNLNSRSAVSGGVERRPCSNMARARFESLDNLRSAGADVASYGPCSMMEEYRGLRGRPAEPRRESFSGRMESARRGEPPTSLAHCLARHDSLKSLTPSGGGGGGGGARIGGSVSNLAAPERREAALPRAGSVTSERLAFAATAPGLAGSGHPARAAMDHCSSSLGSYTARAGGDHSSAGTPSPSDSGVVGLEAALRERDSEINYLRETMEQNEQVIFSVYQEKERNWEKELRKIKAIYDNRLKASQQRALKMEQMLTMQTYQLQQEKRKLRQDIDEARRDKEQCSRQNQQLKQELSSLRTQLEDTEWGLCQKTGEISLLKSQLKDCQGDQTTRSHEMLHIRAQVREYAAQLETKEVDNQRLHAETLSLREQAMDRRNDEANVVIGQLQREMERLRADLSLVRQQAQAQKESFEEERLHWLDEKQKVVNYQKQLQLNYMEMYKRNKSLELELQRSENKLNSSGESQC